MNPIRITGANRDFGAPKSWDPSRDGECATLPVRDTGGSLQSAWQPSADELALLNAGAAAVLTIYSRAHPVVSIGVEPAVGSAPAPQSSNERVLALQLRAAIAWLESTVVPTQAQWDMHHRTLRRIAELLERPAAETSAPLDSEFEMAARRAGIREPLEVYTSNSYRRVGLKSEYKVVLSAIRHTDGQTDISNTPLLEAMVAGFNAMLARSSPEKTSASATPSESGG
jgi:hypothetical protein